jgi:hypothetical protein
MCGSRLVASRRLERASRSQSSWRGSVWARRKAKRSAAAVQSKFSPASPPWRPQTGPWGRTTSSSTAAPCPPPCWSACRSAAAARRAPPPPPDALAAHAAPLPPQAAADALAEQPNYWVPRAALEAPAPGAPPAEAAAAALLALVRAQLPPGGWAGAEYWVQTYAGGRGLAMHFDKDEALVLSESRVVTPLLSSVLYLTGAPAAAVPQAPTVVTDQRFDAAAGRPAPEDPTRSALVFPEAGAYCVFDGALGHGVLEAGGAARRATLLVNWWAARPSALGPAPAPELAAVDGAPAEAADAAVEAAHATPERVAVPVVDVGEEERGTLMVDDLLAAAGVAAGAVALRHPAHALFPIDGEQLRENPEVRVGAALVPHAELTAEGGSSSGSESGGEGGGGGG